MASLADADPEDNHKIDTERVRCFILDPAAVLLESHSNCDASTTIVADTIREAAMKITLEFRVSAS